MNTKIISEEIIKPSHPTPLYLRFQQASLFDHVNGPTLMPLIFFYTRKNNSISTNHVLTQLKNSLPTTLYVFYPLAGRYQDANTIVCNDEGVPYIQAEASSRLQDVVHRADQSYLDKLLPSFGDDLFSELLLCIQVNSFLCGGIAIGIKMSHAISDAFSMFMFIKTWATIANGENHTLCQQPFFKICERFPPHPSMMPSINECVSPNKVNPPLISPRPVNKWFLFTKANINELRSMVCSKSDCGYPPSSTLVLSAFIWTRIKATCKSRPEFIPHEVYHSVNMRREIPIQGNRYFFGNMCVNAIINGSNFVELMQKSIEKTRSSEFVKDMEEGRQNLKFIQDHFDKLYKGEILSIGLSSLKSLPVYESDFGWGKPIWVTSATLVFKDLVIMIPAGPSSDDICVYVSLMRDEMEKLEADEEFHLFSSRKGSNVNSKL